LKCISDTTDATSSRSSGDSDSDRRKQTSKKDKEPGTGGKTAPTILPNEPSKDANNSSIMSTGSLIVDPNAEDPLSTSANEEATRLSAHLAEIDAKEKELEDEYARRREEIRLRKMELLND
jgi:hypothetical protein